MLRKNKELQSIKLFVAGLLNEEQDSHSKLLIELKSTLGNTRQCKDIIEILTKVYEGKIKALEKVFKKIQEIE